jgi:crotonobetainyl-CoA:carnitine CoA-transferase CaiB-like acyl-CoA transferase
MLDRAAFIPLHYAPWPEQERMFADLDALFRSRTRDEWLQFFGDAEVCVGPALTLDEALELHSDRIVTIEQPGEGPLRQIGGLFGETAMRPAPALGEHNEAVLVALGYSAGEVEKLTESGVV